MRRREWETLEVERDRKRKYRGGGGRERLTVPANRARSRTAKRGRPTGLRRPDEQEQAERNEKSCGMELEHEGEAGYAGCEQVGARGARVGCTPDEVCEEQHERCERNIRPHLDGQWRESRRCEPHRSTGEPPRPVPEEPRHDDEGRERSGNVQQERERPVDRPRAIEIEHLPVGIRSSG